MNINLTKDELETTIKALEQFIKVYDGYEMASTLMDAQITRNMLKNQLDRWNSEIRRKAQKDYR